MNIEQNIVDAVSIGKVTKIPVLFISNPGLGKTTILKRYAEKNNMFLQTLIGSRFTPEELAGYQVNNGGTSLTHMNPSWYEEIIENEKKGFPTLLFIDELSTCSESVQGTLLTLIFDRTIGHGKFLPENCLIVAAANYADNLSCFMNILSPTLNRFIIINLNENYTSLDMAEEFLKPAKEPAYHNLFPMNQNQKEWYETKFYEFWRNTFIKYSDPESSYGIIDISNPKLSDIYTENDGVVYNFISGRTLSYLQNAVKAYSELGINNKELFNKMVDGLVGAGSCSFKDKKQAEKYRDYLHRELEKISRAERKDKIDMATFTGDISKDIANFLVNKDNLNTTPDEDLVAVNEIIQQVNSQFAFKKVLELTKTPEGIAKFTSDMESILELQQYVSCFPDAKNVASRLINVAMNYYGLYCDMLGIKVDFTNIFGYTNSLFERVVYIKDIVAGGNEKISRAALRRPEINPRSLTKTLPSLYKIPARGSFLETDLTDPLHKSRNLKVLIWNGRLEFVPVDEYINSIK